MTTLRPMSHRCVLSIRYLLPGLVMVVVRIVQAISERHRLDQLSSHPSMHILSMQTHCQPKKTHIAVVDLREAPLPPQW